MKYPEYVYDYVKQRLELESNDEVDGLEQEEVFDAVVAWRLGHSGWGQTVRDWVADIYKIELDE